jgi:hypothetical protein
LVEHETFNLGAVGSNPTGLTKEFNKLIVTSPALHLLGNILGNRSTRPPSKLRATISREDLPDAIQQLERRLAELPPRRGNITIGDGRAEAERISQKVNATASRCVWRRFDRILRDQLDHYEIFSRGVPLLFRVDCGFNEGVDRAKARLQIRIDLLNEQLSKIPDSARRRPAPAPCVRKVAARIGSEPLGAQEDGRGSIRTAI